MPKKNMRLTLTDLVIETTRRCNMCCEHCLRGDAENIDITKKLLDNVFAGIEQVSTVTFTGGEPSLVPDLIQYALSAAKRYGTCVQEVYIATNGKSVTDKFLKACRDWHVKCLSDTVPTEPWVGTDATRRIVHYKDEGELTGLHVDISMDRFHEDIPRENVLKLCTLPNVHDGKYQDASSDDWVLRTGRADWNGLGDSDARARDPWAYGDGADELELTVDKSGGVWLDGLLYIGATGQILKYCNYSYDDQDDHVLEQIDPVQKDRGWVARLVEKFAG